MLAFAMQLSQEIILRIYLVSLEHPDSEPTAALSFCTSGKLLRALRKYSLRLITFKKHSIKLITFLLIDNVNQSGLN